MTSRENLPSIGTRIGNKAPEFSVSDLNGKTVHLREYIGQPILINFWATWCGPCRREMPYLQQIVEEYADKNLTVLAVNIQESPGKVKEFLSTNQLSIPVFLDKTGQVAKNYGILSIPTTLFLDSDGVIIQKIVGAFPNKETIVAELARVMPN